MSAVRVPTASQIRRLNFANITPEVNPQAHADFQEAWKVIAALDAAMWTKPASEDSIGHALSYGAQLGWIARDYAGCPQLFKSLQIDLLKLLERFDTSDGFARRNAAEAIVAQVRRLMTREVLGTDSRAPRSVQPRTKVTATGDAEHAPF